jgi:ketosteroid isomerase-like protein
MAKETLIKPGEAQVRSVIDSWAQAMRVKDAAGVIAHQAQDFVQFDLAPPLRVAGADPKGLQDWFATWRGPIGYKIRDLHVTVGDDVAFCHGLGAVEIQDSQIGMPVIQAPKGVWNAPIRFDGCSMGEDGAALFGQGHGPRPHRG